MQMQKKIPMRQCLGCREMKPKRELIRVVRAPDGAISLDFKGKASGRGAYICPNASCLKKARRLKRRSPPISRRRYTKSSMRKWRPVYE